MKKGFTGTLSISLALILSFLLYGCGGTSTETSNSAPPNASITSAARPVDGVALYISDCTGCHGPLASSGKSGATVETIKGAIEKDLGGMGVYATLTDDEVQAIATALAPAESATTTSTGTSTSTSSTTQGQVDGAALYVSECSSCHGALAASAKKGATAAAIQRGIANNLGGMGQLSNLTAAQIQAIAAALASPQAQVQTPTQTSTSTSTAVDGAALYVGNCSACHGALSASSKQGATASSIQAGISGNIGGMGMLSGLTAEQIQAIAAALGGAPATTPTPTPAPAPATDGASLYGTYCGSCHGPLATSGKLGATASRIQASIGTVGVMKSLAGLTTTQIQAIAAALSPAGSPTAPPSTTDGTALYASYCGSCHGSLDRSDVRGATASGIQSAVRGVSRMNQLSTLTTEQIQAIAAALGGAPATTPTPTPAPTPAPATDGASLYGTYCSSCHGPLATSGKLGASTSRIQASIGTVGVMSSLSSLTSAQIQAIATALGSTSAPAPSATDGAALYTSYCGSCHGALNRSDVRGTTASQIQSAIRGVSRMNQLATLTATQLQAIATALGTTPTPAPTPTPTPTPTTTDGAALYVNDCAGCHGPLASSTKKGATASQIQAAIANNAGGMGKLSNLTTSQIEAIAAALTPSGTPTTPAPTTDGSALYGSYCSSCHGPLSTSEVKGETASGITSAISGVRSMNQLSGLTSTQIQAIAAALSPSGTQTTPSLPTDGASLYANYCSVCHGALSGSDVKGESSSDITSAISDESRMSQLSGLTSAQIQAIADVLAEGSGGDEDDD